MPRTIRTKRDINSFSLMSDNAKHSLRIAYDLSVKLKSREITSNHLFLGIYFNPESLGSRILKTIGINIENILRSIVGDIELVIPKIAKEVEIPISNEVRDILKASFILANKHSHVYVGTEHIVLAILKDKKYQITKDLEKIGLTYQRFEEKLFETATYPMGILSKPRLDNRGINEQNALEMFGTDLTKEAREGNLDPVVGREEEIEKIINILSRRRKNNPLLVGESGVGKTALVNGLAIQIAFGNVPSNLKDMRIISLDVTSVMAGSKMRGDVEEKMLAIINEVTSSNDIILFIDEIHNVLNSGIPGMPSDIVTVLKPALLRNNFKCIGATTTPEYRSYMEEDNALVRRFQPIIVNETDSLATISILKQLKPILEAHHGVKISKEAIESSVFLSHRYVSDRYLPDKAIDLLDEACALKKLEKESESGDISVTINELRSVQLEKESNIKRGLLDIALKLKEKEEELKKDIAAWEKKKNDLKYQPEFEVGIESIRKVLSKWTGIPITTLGVNEKTALNQLSQMLEKRVVGQRDAINTVSSAIKRARVGISDESRPWATLLFLGPTGVGKTELAKALTIELFGDEDRLIQIDMSEMMEMHSVSKLIGSPPGYIGYKEGGQLTEKIRQNPHSVVLFDEIEKAHPDVLNILLQIMEYGHLTDGKGRKVNFKNTVIILTSNIGAEEIKKDKILGFVEEEQKINDKKVNNAYISMKDNLVRVLKQTLRPELLNRLDDIVIFRSLDRRDAKKIVKLLIRDLNKRIKTNNIKVKLDEGVIEYIVEQGFSEEYGARQLRRVIQDSVEGKIADYLLSMDDLERGSSIVEIAFIVKDNQLNIK